MHCFLGVLPTHLPVPTMSGQPQWCAQLLGFLRAVNHTQATRPFKDCDCEGCLPGQPVANLP